MAKKVKVKVKKKSADAMRREEILRCYTELGKLTPGTEEYDAMRKTIADLKGLKDVSRVDPNLLIRLGGLTILTLGTELVEVPGNIVNLKALKAIQPVVQMLKL